MKMYVRRLDADEDNWTIVKDTHPSSAAIQFLQDWMQRHNNYSDVGGDPINVVVRIDDKEQTLRMRVTPLVSIKEVAQDLTSIHERETCAKLVDDLADHPDMIPSVRSSLILIAYKIRNQEPLE